MERVMSQAASYQAASSVAPQAASRGRVVLDDDEVRPPKRTAKRRKGAGGASRSPRKSGRAPMSSVLSRLPFSQRLSTGAIVAGAAFAALMTGVVFNALFMQTDKHSAPLFPPAPVESATSAPVRIPLPPARAVDAPTQPAPALRASPLPAPPLPAPRPAKGEITGSLGADPFASLMNAPGAERAAKLQTVKPQALKPQTLKPQAPKPQAVKPHAATPHAAMKPVIAAKPHAEAKATSAKPVSAASATRLIAERRGVAKQAQRGATRPADKVNSASVTGSISDEMRQKLAAIGGGAKPAARKSVRAADGEE
jgi:hypothetical protein